VRLKQLLRYDQSCLILIPQRAVGEKKKLPIPSTWKQYQNDPPTWPQIKCWHQENPDALWAYICGSMSGQFTLDFDGPEGLATLKRLGLQPSVRTPSGGAHVWVSAPPWDVRSAPAGPQFPGMEVKGQNVLCTILGERPNGTSYRRLKAPVYRVNDLPQDLRAYVVSRRIADDDQYEPGGEWSRPTDEWILSKLAEALAKVTAGDGRNHVGHWLAQRLYWQGCEQDDVMKFMLEYAAKVPDKRDDPYTTDDVRQTVRQVVEVQQRRPPETIKSRHTSSPDFAPLITRLDGMTPKAIHWLWEGRIAYSKIANFEGDPELGKSLVTLDLGSRATRAGEFPGGSRVERAALLFIAAEDDYDDTIIPRLVAADADLSLCFTLCPRRDGEGRVLPFTLPDDTPLLTRAIEAAKEQSAVTNIIVIVDPVSAYLSERINSNNDASVRRAISPLAEIAKETGCSFWLVRHLNKNSSESNVAYRGGGSIGFFAAARHVFVFGRDKDSPGFIMAQSKNNIGVRQASLAYHIEAVEIADGLTAPRIVWDGHSDVSADQLLSKSDARENAPQRDTAEAALAELFVSGVDELSVGDVKKQLKELGISDATIGRAAKKIGLVSVAVRGDDGKVDHWVYRYPIASDGRIRFTAGRPISASSGAAR